MRKKSPKLKVITSDTTPDAPPPTLDKTGATLWRTILAQFHVDDASGREMLLQACTSADRAADCAAQIAEDGLLINTKAGLKEHPLVKHELAARSFVVRTLQRLGLDVEPLKAVGRPGSGGIGWRGDADK